MISEETYDFINQILNLNIKEMKKLILKGNVKEVLNKEQMKKASGGCNDDPYACAPGDYPWYCYNIFCPGALDIVCSHSNPCFDYGCCGAGCGAPWLYCTL